MAGKFSTKKFNEINLSDTIFDSLKKDYIDNGLSTGFITWFNNKCKQDKEAIVFTDEEGLGAFIVLKERENDYIKLVGKCLPKITRTKISTLKLADRFRGKRLGEGAIGLILWEWQKYGTEEIYITVFDRHKLLVELLIKFGFIFIGNNLNGEGVYLRSKNQINYSDEYKSFPFINPKINRSGYLIINENYHDTMFPYSELKNTIQEQLNLNVANGITKVYIGNLHNIPYTKGDPIFIYRRSEKNPGYKSCITSYCVVSNIIYAKKNNTVKISIDTLWNTFKDKTVLKKEEIQDMYRKDNVIIIEMIYYGYFGKGNNVNWQYLNNNGYWGSKYPTQTILSKQQFIRLLEKGDVDVSSVIID